MLLASGLQILRFSNILIDFIWGAFLLCVIALNTLRPRRVQGLVTLSYVERSGPADERIVPHIETQ